MRDVEASEKDMEASTGAPGTAEGPDAADGVDGGLAEPDTVEVLGEADAVDNLPEGPAAGNPSESDPADPAGDLPGADGTVALPHLAEGEGDAAQAPKRPRRRAAAIAAGLALLAVLGVGGAWAAGAFSGGEAPDAVKDAATSVQAAVNGEAKVSISAKADGWAEDLPAFGFAVVGEDGEVAEEGELTPGEALSLTLPDGVYAVSITSIPTKADGVGTWAPPASQMLQVVDGRATPSEVSFTLLPVNPADAEAVEAVTASLPEAEREAAKQLLAAKKEDPKADKVEVAPVKPQPAPSKPEAGKPSRKWGVVKEAYDEKVLVSAAWDETVVVRDAWTENKLVRDAWTETVNHPAEYRTEKVKVGVYWQAQDGTIFYDEDQAADYGEANGQGICTLPLYEERQVLVKDAWTEKVNHPAEYQTVNHPAETKTVHHDAVYKTVHHDAVYGWI